MNVALSPEKLAQFEALTLDHGSHNDFGEGACAMEVVSWLADEGFTDAPSCASRIVRRYTIALNDRWDDEKRQTLKPYLLRMIGTGTDGLEADRERVLLEYTGRRVLGPWLRLAGLNVEADRVENATDIDQLRDAVRAASDAAWSARSKARLALKARMVEEVKKLRPDAAGADAAAAAAAAVVADAAAVVAAVVTDAAVVAADAAAVAAVAAADAAVAVAAESYSGARWNAAYRAARQYYRDNPLPIAEKVAEIAASQEGLALELLDKLIAPVPA